MSALTLGEFEPTPAAVDTQVWAAKAACSHVVAVSEDKKSLEFHAQALRERMAKQGRPLKVRVVPASTEDLRMLAKDVKCAACTDPSAVRS